MTWPYILPAIALIAVWAYIVRFHPPISFGDMTGHNATVRLSGIKIRRDADYPAAIAAQEIYEFRIMWTWFVLSNIKSVLRRHELESHALEGAAAEMLYGVDILVYLHEEAGRMLSYAHLQDLVDRDPNDPQRTIGPRIEQELIKRIEWARKKARKMRPILERVKAKAERR